MKKNLLDPGDIEWKFISSMALKTYHHSKFIDSQFGIEMEKITNIKADGSLMKPKTYFYITGQDKEYTDIEILW